MAPHIKGFISLKRSIGYKYKEQETCLHNFDRFVLDQGYTGVGLTKDIADKWAENRHNATKLTMYSKINIVKQFAEYLQNQGISTYIPRLPKYPHSAFIPYIYSHQQIDEMFKACDSLKIKQRNLDSCILIIPCLIRLLYGTGIRINEALSLQNKDVDTDVKCLTIRDSKNGKDRLVPISNSLTLVCLDYINQRKKIPMEGLEIGGAPFFVSLNGRSCKYNAVYNWFRKILTIANIPFIGNRKGPRIHDIRHSAASFFYKTLGGRVGSLLFLALSFNLFRTPVARSNRAIHQDDLSNVSGTAQAYGQLLCRHPSRSSFTT